MAESDRPEDFAVRFGFVQPLVDLTDDEMPASLRNGLWDTLFRFFFEDISVIGGSWDTSYKARCLSIWVDFFNIPRDEIPPNQYNAREWVRGVFFKYDFIKIYRFIEYCAQNFHDGEKFSKACNLVLARERSAFHFSARTLVKITNSEELASITESIEASPAIAVRKHVKRAAELYGALPEPDYRNSIKESISAVEAAVQFVTEKNRPA